VERKAFGSDRVDQSSGGDLRLTCAVSKGWQARRDRTLTAPAHPGTAVRWEGALFEVFEAIPNEDGGICYYLEAWDERHTIRVLERYDEESEAARQAVGRRRLDAERRRRSSILLAPLLGHLPGPLQQRMESDFGAPARLMTIASALPLLVLGALGILAFLALAFGASQSSFSGWPRLPLPLGVYLFAESAVRLGVAYLDERPLGSAAGVLLYGLWQRFRRGRAGDTRGYAALRMPSSTESGGGNP